LEYEIKPTNLVKELINGNFLIARGQVLEILSDKMIVEDVFPTGTNYKKREKNNKVKKESVVLNKN
jgi:hypothetical protein